MVRWNKVLSSSRHESSAVDFVEGNLNLRDFRKRLGDEARIEINKVHARGTKAIRTLARKALHRRGISYNLVG